MTNATVEAAAERRQELLELAQAKVGSERVGMGNDPRLHKDTIPTGIAVVDDILGGGFRKGRVGMVVGHESMGKTLFSQWVIKSFQEAGEQCCFIDPEKTYESSWFKKTGVNVDELIVVQPRSIEQTFDLASEWATNGVGLIVVDSLAALTPSARLDNSLEKQEFMGLAPRKISEGLNLFTNENTDAFMLCTNQLRMKLGVVYGSPDAIPGGKAQMYYSSYIIKVRRKGWIKDGEERIGYYMAVRTEKNKLAPPFQEATIPFMYTGAIDTVIGALELALDLGVLQGRRGFYDWKGKKVHGRAKLLDMFRADDNEFQDLLDLIKHGAEGESFG